MEEADIEAIIDIDRSSFSLPWPERSFKYEISTNENSIPLVFEVTRPDGSHEIAGFVVVWVIVDEAHIGTLAVSEAYRGHGIGERLMRTGLDMACKRGCQQSYLEVRRGNEPAIRLYLKLGYQVDGVRPGYYQDNHEDAILMSLKPLGQI
jgi:[ribosomal protein S18]-alanine N-acetyltransferase